MSSDSGPRLRNTGDKSNAKLKSETSSTDSEKAATRSTRPTIVISYQKTFHKPRESLLSPNSGFTNYRGILNLCIVLLTMSMGRLVLENILKYGFLVRFDIPILFIKDPTAWPAALAYICTALFVLFALWVEKKLSKGELSESVGNKLSIGNILTAVTLPAIYLFLRKANPISSIFALSAYTVLAMKLVSYYQVNKSLRKDRQLGNDCRMVEKGPSVHRSKSDEGSTASFDMDFVAPPTHVVYPNNLNTKDIFYFMFVPTLCYDINFPRTKYIRKRFLFNRLAEIALLSFLHLVLIQQWVIPILENSQNPFRESNFFNIVERLLKLAIPNNAMWLIAFYNIFHSSMNAIAELLRFADRQFYRDWWNCEDVDTFWKNWNLPVHNFCMRHIYIPLLATGYTRLHANLVVFFLSAFFHEYLVSIPLRMFRLWSFAGMMMQVPFAMFVSKFCHGNFGNMAVWFSLIIGQPIAIMMYVHDYYIDAYSKQPM